MKLAILITPFLRVFWFNGNLKEKWRENGREMEME
jgi:hypothetical protein